MKQIKDMLCPMCLEGKLVYKLHHSTHIYTCDICSFTALEYIGQQNAIDFINYLQPKWLIQPKACPWNTCTVDTHCGTHN